MQYFHLQLYSAAITTGQEFFHMIRSFFLPYSSTSCVQELPETRSPSISQLSADFISSSPSSLLSVGGQGVPIWATFLPIVLHFVSITVILHLYP